MLKWRHSNLSSHYDLYAVGNTAYGAYYVKVSGEDLLRYSDEIESVGLRKCPYYRYLTKKMMSQIHNNKHFSELQPAPHHRAKTATEITLGHSHAM